MDQYKRSILKKNKIYRPYTILGIGNFIFFRRTRTSTPTMCGTWTRMVTSTTAAAMSRVPTGEI